MDCNRLFPPVRDLELLDPHFKQKVKAWLSACPQIAVSETLRSAERQKCLREHGRSWVERSNHQDGLAVDVYFKEKPHYPPSGDPAWMEVIGEAKKFGIDSGYTLWGTDTVHFQDDGTEYLPEPFDEADMNSAMWNTLEDIKGELTAMQEALHARNNDLRRIDNVK